MQLNREERMKWLKCLGQFLGRMLLSLIFIVAGAGKIFDFNGTIQYMQAHSLVYLTPVILIATMVFEIVCGICLLIGYKARAVALLLFLFLIPTTYLFHGFWNSPEQEQSLQSIMFFKNLAIMGGLLFLASTSPGAFAINYKSECTKQNEL